MSKLTFNFSSMDSGKSLSLLTKNHMLNSRGINTILMKPSIDDRDGDVISTRLGLSHKCFMIDENVMPSAIILDAASDRPDQVLIDEAQFLSSDQVTDLCNLVDNWGISVHCFGLKLNWMGDFFEGSLELMKHADELIQCDTICPETGGVALYHIKNSDDLSVIQTGKEDVYKAVSRKVWKKWFFSKKSC